MTLPQKLGSRHFLILLAISLLLLVVIFITRPDKSAELRAPIISSVEVLPIRRGAVHPSLKLSGRLQPRLAATLSAEVSGRVVERAAEAGEQVEAEALLLRLDEGDYRDALARAEAQLSQERAAIARDRHLLELARENRQLQANEVARLERLGSESLASASRRDEARQRLLQLEAEEARLDYSVATAAARISLRRADQTRAMRDLERCRIVAPFAGTVNDVLVDEGDRIAVNQAMVSLVDMGELDFYAELPGDAATVLSLGQVMPVRVDGESREGRLVSLQSEPDRRTHTLALRIRLPGEGLVSGALAEASVPLRSMDDALMAPVSAVLREDGKAYLFVEQSGRLSRRQVETGLRDGNEVVIRSGVAAGEHIVARDVAALSDGQTVKVLAE